MPKIFIKMLLKGRNKRTIKWPERQHSAIGSRRSCLTYCFILLTFNFYGHKLKKSHDRRQTIRNFLEGRCKISKVASRELFFLLEEAGTLCYRVDIPEDPKDAPLVYYPYEEEFSA